MVTKTRIRVSHSEIDHLGIVHHSNYPLWFESGRHDYLKHAGLPESKIRAMGFCLPLAELKCEFKSPAKLKDEIIILTNATYLSYAKIKFEYTVMNTDEKLIAIGNTVHAWADRSIKPLNIKKEAPELYESLKKFSEAP